MNEDIGFIGALGTTSESWLQELLAQTDIVVTLQEGAATNNGNTEPAFFQLDTILHERPLRLIGTVSPTDYGSFVSGGLFLAEWLAGSSEPVLETAELVKYLAESTLRKSGLCLVLGREDCFETSMAPGLVGCYSEEFWTKLQKRWNGRSLGRKLELSGDYHFVWPTSVQVFFDDQPISRTLQLALDELGEATQDCLEEMQTLKISPS